MLFQEINVASQIIKETYLFAIITIALQCTLSFVSSFLYFAFAHTRGVMTFLTKMVLIAIIAAPFCIASAVSMTLILLRTSFLLMKNGVSRRRIKDEAVNSFSKDDTVVHLVHGTFESKAPWTFSGSPMWVAIQRKNPSVKLARFEWSGDNTQSAREEAANNFAKAIESSCSNDHYIVAHSHAGNIVQMISQRPSIAEKIRGVCLLSTPFIYRKIMDRSCGELAHIHTLGLITFAELIGALILWPFGLFNHVAIVIILLISLAADFFLGRKIGRAAREAAGQEDNCVDFRDVQIMSSIGDEADSSLRFISTLHESCFGILSQLSEANRCIRKEKKMMGPDVICYSLHFIMAMGVVASALWTSIDRMYFCIPIAASAALALIAGAFNKHKDISPALLAASLPVGIVAFYINALKSIAYGDWRLIFCPSVFIYSSETPVGDHRILKYAPSSDGALVHSTHSHGEVIRDVAEWIFSTNSNAKVVCC